MRYKFLFYTQRKVKHCQNEIELFVQNRSEKFVLKS